MKILIAGDSFACVWPNGDKGWPQLLACEHDVNNIAQAGASEYRIWLQLRDLDLTVYDMVIVSHSSPNRVYVQSHPIPRVGLHANCDLIFSDIDRFRPWNRRLTNIKAWFRYYFDETYHNDIYDFIRKEIMRLIPSDKYICTTHSHHRSALACEPNNIDFTELWSRERGNINHYTDLGNMTVYKLLTDEMRNRRK